MIIAICRPTTAAPIEDSVLLSLSGDVNGEPFRHNVAVDEGSEEFVFDALFPGTYFVRPMLKEYVFGPTAAELVVGEGASQKH